MKRVCYRFRRTLFAVSMILISAIIISINVVSVEAVEEQPADKFYTSIQIEPGQTLWNIADTYYTDDYEDYNDYIDEVISLNHLSDSAIHAGQYLVVPYYAVD